MAHAHCMLDAEGLNKHSEYVIGIVFSLLHERASVLRYTFIACLVNP